MREIPYNRRKAVDYAHKWAFGRNPAYFNFDPYGGDCTNFASQALYAGCGVMNYAKDTGWYYSSPANRAAAWSGVEFLHRFLVANKGVGPYAEETDVGRMLPGDLIQLKLGLERFSHSLIVVSTGEAPSVDNILITTHTFNSDNRPLNSYDYRDIRFLHIPGARTAGRR